MKIVISLVAYVVLFDFANGAPNPRNQRGLNQRPPVIHPFNIPPGSIIFIDRMRNGTRLPGHTVYGTLHHVPGDFSPENDNEPYGNVFVVIDDNNEYHARLLPGRTHDHINNNPTHNGHDGDDTHFEIPAYICYIRRPPHRGLTAVLLPVIEDNMHDVPHVDYMASGGIHFQGQLSHVPVDDLAIQPHPEN